MCEAGIIAALYAVLTYVAAMMNLAYGEVQFRFSEVLTVLPVFTPAAVPGLTLGCFISNLASPLGIVDWVFGSLATFLAAVTGRMLRKIEINGIPFLSILMPVLFNAVIIGIEIICISDSGAFSFANASMAVFWPVAMSVGLGELVICVALGIPFIVVLRKTGTAKRIFSDHNLK